MGGQNIGTEILCDIDPPLFILFFFLFGKSSGDRKGRSPFASAAIATLDSMIFALRKDYVMCASKKS